MKHKCDIMKSLDEANSYLECVSRKIRRKKKKKCENHKNGIPELFKLFECNCGKKER
ncbi:MAG: hypothetical protein J5590_08295 [Clostridia bacterium]|nr:hypothetical protein [Clostridia bacterium]